ncbi:MAG: DUF3180 domain-containing protein [Arcanobacterium sp.]|nr:DUF3180 domain-containing protein [Arcanobacterium sp.]
MNTPQKSENSGKQNQLQTTSMWMLLALFGVIAVPSFLLTDIWVREGYLPLMLPRITFLVPVLLTLILFALGWQVRRYKQRKAQISPLTAARIWLFSLAASRTGALIAGGAFGVMLVYARHEQNAFFAEQTFNFGAAAVASVALCVTALVVEYWCRVNDDEEEELPGGSAAAI